MFQTRCQGQRVEYVPRKVLKDDDVKRGHSAKSVKFSSKATTKVLNQFYLHHGSNMFLQTLIPSLNQLVFCIILFCGCSSALELLKPKVWIGDVVSLSNVHSN